MTPATTTVSEKEKNEFIQRLIQSELSKTATKPLLLTSAQRLSFDQILRDEMVDIGIDDRTGRALRRRVCKRFNDACGVVINDGNIKRYEPKDCLEYMQELQEQNNVKDAELRARAFLFEGMAQHAKTTSDALQESKKWTEAYKRQVYQMNQEINVMFVVVIFELVFFIFAMVYPAEFRSFSFALKVHGIAAYDHAMNVVHNTTRNLNFGF